MVSRRKRISTGDPPGMYEAAFNASPSSMAILDEDGRIVAVNRRWANFSVENEGPADAFIGEKYLDMVPTGTDAVLDRIHHRLARLIGGYDQTLELEYPCHSPETKRWFMMRAMHFEYAGGRAILVIHTDITARRLAEDAAREAASTDALTGLLNRRSFTERARQVLARTKREKQLAAVLFIDLDDFKDINDELGHAAGDQALVAVGRRLTEFLRETDAPARIGGDEFSAVCQMPNREAIDALLSRLLPALDEPLMLNRRSLKLSFSIGVAVWPHDGHRFDDLLDAADQAMYRSKLHKGSAVEFADSLSRKA